MSTKTDYFAYPPQDPEEFEQLCQLVRIMKPEVILEIGSRHGQSILRLTEAAMPTIRKVVVIDLPDQPWGRPGSWDDLEACSSHLSSRGVQIELHKIDSHGPLAAKVAEDHVGQVDFIFFDGDHTLAGIRQDWETFYPCLTAEGFAAFHDIDGQGKVSRGQEIGVPEFWWEQTLNWWGGEVREFNSHSGYGIGVLFKN